LGRLVQFVEQPADGFLQGGMNGLGGDLGQGFEDEAPFVHPGMRDGARRPMQGLPVEEQQVQVDGAGPPTFGPPAAEGMFGGQQQVEQSGWVEGGLHAGGGVEITALAGRTADRVSFVKTGEADRLDALSRAQQINGRLNDRLTVTQIGSQADICDMAHGKVLSGGVRMARDRMRLSGRYGAFDDSTRDRIMNTRVNAKSFLALELA